MQRVWVSFLFLCSFFAVILARLFYWQVIVGNRLKIEAVSQYNTEFLLPASRGQILDYYRNPWVINQPSSLIYAQPPLIPDKITFAQKVSEILKLDQQSLLNNLQSSDKVWLLLAHKIENETVTKIKNLGLSGIGFEKEPKRYYPEASAAAHLLGFVGANQLGQDKGYFGIEGFYDRELHGKDGLIELERDVTGSPILIGDAKRIEAVKGRDLVLWVDRTVQRIVEMKLNEAIAKYGAKEGTVVVMDPQSGGMLAMASYPAYDPGDFTKYNKDLYKNPAVANAYEPGSTFKILVIAAGLSQKVIFPTTTVDEKGPLQIDQYQIRTWNDEYHGQINMTDVLRYSSNVGMVEIAQKLGKEKFLKYIKDYGFGKLTGVDLEDETTPDLRADNEWREIDMATASFGQGIAVTPLQMTRAAGAIANGGWIMEPHVVKEIVDNKGQIIKINPKKERQVFDSWVSKTVTEMMVYSVDNGEAKWAKPKGYRIAGKTGTAQIPVAGHYDEKKTIASFVGFAPADDPKFVMLVTLREPASSPWGSETAAPLFFQIARELLNYYGISPQ